MFILLNNLHFCQVILIHAALRLRNLLNKIENQKELLGLKKSPMGLLLEFLGID